MKNLILNLLLVIACFIIGSSLAVMILFVRIVYFLS
nr:MAG TPA: hypothetical protein [Bacteriophage sp.]DAR62886.1 MAG TPA: hypothetical protein [Caudoviricetes sp.]